MNGRESQENAELDEVDLSLVNALQFDPRASWSTVGAALGIDPVTAARRWARLTDSGAAWVTAHPAGPQSAALLEADCVAGALPATAEALARRPQVLSVEHTSGSRGLLLTVSAPTLADLSRLVLDIETLPGIRSTGTHLVVRPVALGGDWQMRALDAGQRGHFEARTRRAAPPRPLDATDRRLVTALCGDGRASLTDLAGVLDCSVSTARRRLRALQGRGTLRLRCDVAQPLSGWPVSVSLWAHVPVDECDTVTRLLADLPETRACLVLAGAPANVFHVVWVRSLDDVHRVEAHLRRIAPTLQVLGRSVTLRSFKRMGRILDEHGRSVGSVPMDIWTPGDTVEGGTGADVTEEGSWTSANWI